MTPYLIGGVVGAVVGLVAVIVWLFITKQDARRQAAAILEEGRRAAGDLAKEAELKMRENELAAKARLDQETNETKDKLRDLERDLDRRQASLEQKSDGLRKQERIVEGNQRKLTDKLERISVRETELEKVLDQQRQMLHQVSGLDKAEATTRLMKLLEDELASETGAMILKHERQIKETVEEKSRELLITTMQRFAATHTAESTTSTVDIPNDDMKGRIIGREGRNIRAFEKETGVDVIIDDTPGVVIVSGFDPVRREVARQSLVKLIADGRIHPVRIEEVVKETQAELEDFIIRKGKEAAQEADVPGLHERIIYLLGRLHFRTSYSQNVLRHSIEVAFLSGMLAEMVGLDGNVGRRCGLLHDIGKAADHELEGGHPKIGADLLKRHGEGPQVVHAALGHHDDIVIEHPYTMLVATADACSASRPGARRESLERYVKRMEELESIALEHQGVQQAFAIQAGREVRVLVSSDDVDDRVAAKVCRDIAGAYEERLAYPGEIKVTVIRESRFTELAR
ncbi:MAG: ribonuclease Y [Planctomycetales bacterium]|nr:ribonuclease Y [Planctomycetales bacterium]